MQSIGVFLGLTALGIAAISNVYFVLYIIAKAVQLLWDHVGVSRGRRLAWPSR